jgi:predicted phosphodiesterase
MKKLSFAMFFLTFAAGCSSQPLKPKTQPEFFAWTELGPNTQLLARVVSSRGCPSIEIDSKIEQMTMREKETEKFPVNTCETVIPRGAKSVLVHGNSGSDDYVSLPLLVQEPKKIIVFGDTGCRMKYKNGKGIIQNCNDANEWPFPKIAAKAAQEKPDLVIHVGDYLYRETPCPIDSATRKEMAKCAGAVWGNGWDGWKADFFSPAAPLLQSAPWIFVRGNHELCARAGEGWFRFLDPRLVDKVCSDRTETYRVEFPSLKMSVLDSSSAEDDEAKSEDVNYFTHQIQLIQAGGASDWVLTHRPFWSGKINKTLQESAKNAGLSVKGSPFDLILAGHVHLFEAFTFDDHGPSQLVLGNGGTQMVGEETVKEMKAATTSDSRKIKKAIVKKDFGYLVLDQNDLQTWSAEARSSEGKVITHILINRKLLTEKKTTAAKVAAPSE